MIVYINKNIIHIISIKLTTMRHAQPEISYKNKMKTNYWTLLPVLV